MPGEYLMATRMLIDARHPEETRVAVLKGNRIEEFDFESADHKQIKGNIYLAKVTRVEPSLQAAFVDFGGNRHGFLAFSEIHPDYYQIPAEDRQALLAEEQAAAEEEAALRAEEDEDDDVLTEDQDDSDEDEAGVEEIDTSEKDDVSTIEDGQLENGEDDDTSDDDGEEGDEFCEEGSEDEGEESGDNRRGRGRRGRGRRQGRGKPGGGDRRRGSRAKEIDDVRAKRQALRRRYKIQDVIQRRQVLLVQVVKEERGNKGAALTTYLSLAGRYCVLMPNSSHGGGISRKISNGSDRKRLKQIVSDLTLPKSMGLIVRTAGLRRTKTEIKRDFDYLARLWDEIRERTLGSSAPKMIHSDSDLIKRAIRDIYNREIEEVVVEGEDGYKAAKAFMKLLMPSHARRVKAYSDPVPLFQRYGAEDQLSAMYDPMVQLKSGGYLIINPTEALVSIDINSGRSTKEHGIEQTALHTNLEAAKEIARQLRLRDMAGLVVIDFIDMEHNSNVRKVERCMKDSLKNDRARIQVGRISSFGLMEMSRQRLRTGVLEATTRTCPHCDGTGLVRTASSAGLSALRFIEDEAAKGKGTVITLYASTEAAVYLLNAKRADLAEIEQRYSVTVQVVPEGEDEGAKMRVTSSGPRPTAAPKFDPIVDDDDYDAEVDDEEEIEEASRNSDDEDEDAASRNKKRRRRRRGGRNRNRNRDRDENDSEKGNDDGDESDDAGDDSESRDDNSDEGEEKPKRRRRRGGRGRGRKRNSDAETENGNDAVEGETEGESSGEADEQEAEAPADAEAETPAEAEADEKPKRRTRRKKADPEAAAEEASEEAAENAEAEAEEKPKPKPRTRRKKAEPEAEVEAEGAAEEPAEAVEKKPAAKKPAAKKRAPRKKAAPKAAADEASVTANDSDEAPAQTGDAGEGDVGEDGEPRRGWWQRTFGN